MFSITREQLDGIYNEWYEYFKKHGYATWEYWHTTEAAAAVYGEMLDTALSESGKPGEWDAIWAEWKKPSGE